MSPTAGALVTVVLVDIEDDLLWVRYANGNAGFLDPNGLIAAVDELKNITDEITPTVEPAAALVVAGTKLNLDLANHHSVKATALSPATLVSLLDDGTLEGKLAALNTVADKFYANHGDLERDEEKVGVLRQEAWQSAQVLVSLPSAESPAAPPEPETPVLELEFIAMYW